jgi:hypothetical protein
MLWVGVVEPESPRRDSFVELCVSRAVHLGHIGPDDELRCAGVRGENESRNVGNVFRRRGKKV